MKINSKTMLFEELSKKEAEDLYELARKNILYGVVNFNHPYFQFWLRRCGFEENAVVVISNLFPARTLLSLVEYYKNQQGKETVQP